MVRYAFCRRKLQKEVSEHPKTTVRSIRCTYQVRYGTGTVHVRYCNSSVFIFQDIPAHGSSGVTPYSTLYEYPRTVETGIPVYELERPLFSLRPERVSFCKRGRCYQRHRCHQNKANSNTDARKMQRLEVVRGHSEFLSHFSTPQANPTPPVGELRVVLSAVTRLYRGGRCSRTDHAEP